MRKTILLAATLPLVCIGMLIAKPQQDPSHGKSISIVRGCLKASTSGFALRGEDGSGYELIGDTTEITKLLGKEVEVKGLKTSGIDVSTGLLAHPGETVNNSGGVNRHVIEVSNASAIADHCRRQSSRDAAP